MHRLSAQKKLSVVRKYLSGLSYDEIAIKTGVSKGTVSNIVNELRAGTFPEAADAAEHIELLRDLSLDLKRAKLTPGQCAAGLIVLNRIRECGLEPADIDRWPMILRTIAGENEAQEFIRQVYSILEIQKRTGLGLDALDDRVHELEKKAAELEPLTRQRDTYKKQVKELDTQREKLTSTVANLEEKHKLLSPCVRDLEGRERDLSGRVKNMEARAGQAEATIATLNKETRKFWDIGLSFKTLAEVSQRLGVIAHRHGITPDMFRDRLLRELENLDKGLGLETLAQKRQLELEKLNRSVTAGAQELEANKASVETLRKQKAGLEASIQEMSNRVTREIAKMTPAAMEAVRQLVEKINLRQNEALAEVHHLRDEALEVGREIGRYEEVVRDNRWITQLSAIARGEDNVEGRDVKTIALSVVHGVIAWLNQQSGVYLAVSSLRLAAENLLRELEQWKV
jgi:transcriptional regulator with XRE-family HTH domain